MKYYAQKSGCMTIRKIIADSDEEALKKAMELFGTDDVIVGNLKKKYSKEELKQIYKDTEDAAGRILGPVGKAAMKIMHSV